MVKIDIKKITIGTDPELFLERDGEIISAEGLIGGTKYNPKVISEKGHAVQEDNIMVEFNIPPSNTPKEFVDHINYVLTYLDGVAALNGAKLSILASANINPEYLNTEQAKMFGCEPDYNVYTRSVNNPPNPRGHMRSCGGHIHLGYPSPNVETSEKIIKAMDLFLGVPSVLMDEDNRRKKMYGKAGAFRFKDFGIEFRVLSNFWLKSDKLKKWAFNSIINAVEFLNNEDNYSLLLKSSDEIVRCINNNDKELALSIMDKFKKVKVINKKIKTI